LLNVIGFLEIHPEVAAVAEKAREPNGAIGSDAALAIDNGIYPERRNMNRSRQICSVILFLKDTIYPMPVDSSKTTASKE